MNSSPPPPSFTLPPLNSSGQFPVTPPGSHSPSPSAEGSKSRAGKNVNHGDASEDGGRVSMYVKLFEEMIVTVLASESYLFTPREIHVLRYILDLAYAPKYLLTRLLLRRPCKIHPLGALMTTYSPEIGEQGVKAAARTLSHEISIPADLLRDEPNAEPDASSRLPVTPGVPARSYPTPESSKDAKKRLEGRKLPWADLPTGLTPEEERSDPDLAAAIRESMWASRVGRVELDEDGTVVDSPPPERATPSRSVSGSSTSSTTAQPSRPVQYDEVFSLEPKQPRPVVTLANSERNMTLEDIMSCVSADELKKLARARKVPTAGLINRQSTVDALKALASKQTTLGFTPVKGKSKDTQATLPFTPKRTTNSEDLLIKSLMPLLGHGAVQLTPELHSLIGRVNLIFSRTPPLTATSSSLMLPSILVTSHKRRYPEYGPPTRSKIWQSRDELLIWERAVHWESVVGDAMGDSWAEMRKNPLPRMGMRTEMLGRVEGAKVVKRIWEGIWPVWQELVAGEGGKSVDPTKEDGGLVGDRFKTGHVLTRIVYKAAAALGILHDYDLECEVLKALLAQRRWRRSKRGAWYDRLALVLMNHYNATPQEKEEKLMEATQVCIDGLLDEETHMIYRPGLSRRLTRLENKLDLPSDERHISYASLMTSSTRELAAPRVKENLGAPKFRPQNDSDRTRDASLGLGDEGLERSLSIQQTGKSVWVGKDSEVTVEGWVLEWWEAQGYKGYHSEGSIITTLFGLLMWPVLFHSLPGAFETPYQTAPLDLGEDTFAPARAELFETLLQKMSKTEVALEMLRETDDRERARVTWAVGINWEYEKKDLEELVECLGGMALSGICRMLGEEYRHRVSGVPDLIVWHPDKKEARFVEVKGPGDSLSETQKIWIDVLLSSGVPVEVCRVVAKSDKASTQATERLSKKRRATSIASSRRAKRTPSRSEDIPDPEEVEDDEWQYQSGEEGKPEGHWAKDG